MVSLLNGFSQMGAGVAAFAQSAGLEQQKSDLEKQQLTLANQLQEGTQTRLIPLQGDQARQTATVTAQEQGKAATATAAAANALPMSDEQKAVNAVQKGTLAETVLHDRFDEKKPVSLGLYGGAATYDPMSGTWKPIAAAGSDIGPPDPTSDNLSKQIGLSLPAIHAATGDLTGRAAIPYLNELGEWAAKNGKNVDTIKAQAKAINASLTATETRNQLATTQEREIAGSISTITPILDAMNAGKINKANVLKIWGGGQVNDPDAMKAVDQITRLKEELAGYNAIANAKITNGHPNPEANEIKAAEDVITNGLNSGSLKAFGESIESSTQKNREVLAKATDDANTNMYNLFGGTFHKQPTSAAPADSSGGAAAPPAAAKPAIPAWVKPGDAYSPSRDKARNADGTEYGAP